MLENFFKIDCIFAVKTISGVYIGQKRDARRHKYFLCLFFHPATGAEINLWMRWERDNSREENTEMTG